MSAAQDITNWLISEGRRLGDGVAIVEGYASRLVAAGVPLSRANIAQRFANPLLVAWGVIWTPESTSQYDVTHAMLDTSAYIGSPFEHLLTSGKPFQKSLVGLDRDSTHSGYLELADAGGKDLFAMALDYGDGSANGCTFVSNDTEGFQTQHVDLIKQTFDGLASAMEPVTMRKSTESLLRTYIGRGPALAVCEGTIQHGEHKAVDAVVMFSDLRGFTSKSETWDETALLTALNGYFGVVVQAVEDHGGDVLKFMGDGILSIFPVDSETSRNAQCRSAINAARDALVGLDALNADRQKFKQEALAIGIGINVGPVTYGNIGSPNRLDFSVLGPAVNLASRVENLCKQLGEPILATEAVASIFPDEFIEKGRHGLRGVAMPTTVYTLRR